MSLPEANFVKNHDLSFLRCTCRRHCEKCFLVILKGFAVVKNDLICMVLRFKSELELLVLKNLRKCTSQRIKRPSGARVMICSRSLSRSVARSPARSLGRSVARSVARSLPRSLTRSLARSIARQALQRGSPPILCPALGGGPGQMPCSHMCARV